MHVFVLQTSVVFNTSNQLSGLKYVNSILFPELKKSILLLWPNDSPECMLYRNTKIIFSNSFIKDILFYIILFSILRTLSIALHAGGGVWTILSRESKERLSLVKVTFHLKCQGCDFIFPISYLAFHHFIYPTGDSGNISINWWNIIFPTPYTPGDYTSLNRNIGQ